MATYKLTPKTGVVSGSHTDFPAFFNPLMFAVTNGLSLTDMQSARFYTDVGLTVEIAREIVTVGEQHFKVPTFSSASEIYMVVDGVSSDYAVTDTYGRNAVWPDYYAVWHMQGASASADKRADSTGNGRSLTEGNSPSSTNGKLGGTDGAYDHRGVAGATNNNTGKDWLERPSGILVDIGSSAFTIQGWFNPDFTNTIAWPMGYLEANSAAGRPYARGWRLTGQELGGGVETATNQSNDFPTIAGSFANDTWTMWAFGRNSSNYPFGFANGSMSTSTTLESGTFATATAPFYLGRRFNTSYSGSQYYADGQFDEVRIRFTYLNEDWLDTEYNNQNDVANFWDVVEVGGGGGNNQAGYLAWL